VPLQIVAHPGLTAAATENTLEARTSNHSGMQGQPKTKKVGQAAERVEQMAVLEPRQKIIGRTTPG
jgi:hypothetical protein